MSSSYKSRSLGASQQSKYSRQKISDLEAQRKQFIQDATNASKGDIAEAVRQDKVLTFTEKAELQQLSTLSKTFEDFLQKTVVDVSKYQWEKEINRGWEMYKTRHENDEWNQLNAKVDESLSKQEDLEQETRKLADKAPLEVDKKRIRNLSHFEQMGWGRARLQEAADNYGAYRLSELQQNTLLLNGPDGEFAINKPNKTDKEYEIASSYILGQYIEENGQGFTSDYITTKFLPALEKTETAQKKDYYKQQRIDAAGARIDSDAVAFGNVVLSDPILFTEGPKKGQINEEATVARITKAIKTSYLGRSDFGVHGINSRDGVNRGWQNHMLNAYQELIDSGASPATLARVRKALANFVIEDHPAGARKLSEVNVEFEEKQLALRAYKRLAQNQSSITQGQQAAIESALDAANITVREYWTQNPDGKGISTNERNRIMNEIATLPGITEPQIQRLITILDTKPLSPVETAAKLDGITNAGEISEVRLTALDKEFFLDPGTVQNYRDRGIITDEPFVTPDVAGLIAIHTGKNGTFETSLRGLKKDFQGTTVFSESDKVVLAEMNGEISLLAKGLFEQAKTQGQPITKEQAYNFAAKEISNRLKLINTQGNELYNPNDRWYYDTTTQSFSNILPQGNSVRQTAIKIDNNKRWLDAQLDNDKNAIINIINPHLTAQDFKVSSRTQFRPQAVFYELAKLDGQRTAYEIYNAQAEMTGFAEPIQLDENGLALNGLVSRMPVELKRSFSNFPGSKVFQSQLLGALSLYDSGKMKNALFETNYTNTGKGWSIVGLEQGDTGHGVVFGSQDTALSFTKMYSLSNGNLQSTHINFSQRPIHELNTESAHNGQSFNVSPGTTSYRWMIENGEKHDWSHQGGGTFVYTPPEYTPSETDILVLDKAVEMNKGTVIRAAMSARPRNIVGPFVAERDLQYVPELLDTYGLTIEDFLTE